MKKRKALLLYFLSYQQILPYTELFAPEYPARNRKNRDHD